MADGSAFPKTCTTCPYCGVGCGVEVRKISDDIITVTGDENHPANYGKLCSKGSALAETLTMEDRLLYPYIQGERASWDEATDTIASKFQEIMATHGPDSIAFYVSGQILTEDYYIANKLMKGFIGSANIDTNSRLCMASSVAGHKRAFGADIVPGCYDDLEKADLLIFTGSNFAWCHPVLYQRVVAAKKQRPKMKVIVIDPRQTATCDIADLHLPIAPGSDVALFQGLFHYLYKEQVMDEEFVSSATNGFSEALIAAAPFDFNHVLEKTELKPGVLSAFYKMVAAQDKTVTIYSQGVNQAQDGTDRVNAIINTHLLTGRIGKIGAGPFSITGQPNAMGGREVGGLANMLACHMDIENERHRDLVQRFWKSPTIATKPGLKAVDLFEAIHAGKIKAVWIMATNPVDSMPNANFVRSALEKCELVVVSDIIHHTDTAACATVLLPATGWGEKDGTVTNSERRISRQRAFAPAPGETRHDWQALCEVAKKMGWAESFDFTTASGIFSEYAALSGFENDGNRDLNIAGLANLSQHEYDMLTPIQWPVAAGQREGTQRFFENKKYYTDDQKARFVAPAVKTEPVKDPQYPFILNTGRIRDQWHTMTRTGRAARLSQHIAEPFIEINPIDAGHFMIQDADIVRVKSPNGEILVRALLTTRQRRGSVFVPMHWTDRFASSGRVDSLTTAIVDPISGQPALKSSTVTIEKYPSTWYGFAAISTKLFEYTNIPKEASYWSKARTDRGIRLELAGINTPENWQTFFKALLHSPFEHTEYLVFKSAGQNQLRMASFTEGTLLGLFYIAPSPVTVSREWAVGQLDTSPGGLKRHLLLAGRPGDDMPDIGAIICSCMNIGRTQIIEAGKNGHNTVYKIGQCTTAGTNCGSCQPEIKAILEEMRHAETV